MTPEPTMRLGYLVSRYPAVSHTFILREILALRHRGFEIEVASINPPDNSANLTHDEDLETARAFYVKRAGAIGAAKAFASLLLRPKGLARGLVAALRLGQADLRRTAKCLFYWAEALILAKWMKDQRLTHLHVHFATPASTVALILERMSCIGFSMTVHGPDEFYDVPGYYLNEKILASRFVVCISFFAQSQLMKLSQGADWHRFEIGRLGVDCSHFTPRVFRPHPERFQILCVGRLVPTKGQRVLIEAVAHLLDEGRPVQLTFIGDGPDKTALRQLVSERGLGEHITFAGAISQDEIQSFYSAADIFALASFAEGIPVVLMEAMAMEIPCVSTAINGIPELIEDGVNGLLVPPSDVQSLRAALARLMDETELRESLGKNGRDRVQQQYEISKSADRLARIFRSRLQFGS